MGNKQIAQQRADQILAFYNEVMRLEEGQMQQLDEDQRVSVARYHERLLRYMVRLNIGKRLEPWIESATQQESGVNK